MSEFHKMDNLIPSDLSNVSSFEDNKNKMLDFVYKSNYLNDVYKLGLNDEMIKNNIDKVFDYVSDLNYCQKCPGINSCKKDNPYNVVSLEVNGNFVKRQLNICKAMLRRIEFISNYIYRDFNEEWINSTLNNKVLNTNARKEVAVKYKYFLLNKSFDWIYIYGAISTGRSYICALLCNDFILRSKKKVAFIDTPKRIKELYGISNKEIVQRRIDELCNVDLLVFDDFGNEYKNDFIRDGIIIPIISYRASHHLLTIFISNFSINDIAELYSLNKAGAIRSRQLANLIKSNCKNEINFGDLSIY